jgi:Predicted transcriptional regulator with C-terminal CBS domains
MEDLPLADSIALNCSVYDEDSFEPAFKECLSKAKFSVIIMAPYITGPALFRLLPTFKTLVADDVQVCIYLRPPAEYYKNYNTLSQDDKDKVDYFVKNLNRLINAGVHVTLSDKIHQKVAVVDGRWLWDGSLNILSYNPKKSEERMTCIDSPLMAMCAMGKHGLLNCPHCHKRRLEAKGLRYSLLRSENFGAQIREKRKARGLNQAELAEIAGVSRKLIVEIEGGNISFKPIDTMIAILDALDEEVITVPRDCIPLIEGMLWSLKARRLTNQSKSPDERQKFVRRFVSRRKSVQGTGASGDQSGNLNDPGVEDFSVPRSNQNSDVEGKS